MYGCGCGECSEFDLTPEKYARWRDSLPTEAEYAMRYVALRNEIAAERAAMKARIAAGMTNMSDRMLDYWERVTFAHLNLNRPSKFAIYGGGDGGAVTFDPLIHKEIP